MVDGLSVTTGSGAMGGRVRTIFRLAWIAARLVLAYYLGHSDHFFYQGF